MPVYSSSVMCSELGCRWNLISTIVMAAHYTNYVHVHRFSSLAKCMVKRWTEKLKFKSLIFMQIIALYTQLSVANFCSKSVVKLVIDKIQHLIKNANIQTQTFVIFFERRHHQDLWRKITSYTTSKRLDTLIHWSLYTNILDCF